MVGTAQGDCFFDILASFTPQGGTPSSINYPIDPFTVNLFEGDTFTIEVFHYGPCTWGPASATWSEWSVDGGPIVVYDHYLDTLFGLSATGHYEITYHSELAANNAIHMSFDLVNYAPLSATMLELQAGVFLDGPFDPGTQLMQDAYRSSGALSTYAFNAFPVCGAGEIGTIGYTATSIAVLNTTGADAPVDWVLVELRDEVDPTVVLAAKAGLVQRDGDIVNADGSAPFRIRFTPGSYHVAVRHINHLGAMTEQTIGLSTNPTPVDFRLMATALYGIEPTRLNGGLRTLWAGNTSCDPGVQMIKYAGPNNDRDQILLQIGGVVPTNSINASYSQRRFDTNLDGVIKYSGTNNDRDVILNSIGGVVVTSTRVEQLPQ